MTEKTLFLHAGYPRTGTTSFQHMLDDNRAALAKAGYAVPPTIGFRHRQLQAACQTSINEKVAGIIGISSGEDLGLHLENWLKDVVEATGDMDKVIMSEETVSVGDPAALRGMQKLLKKFFDRVVILVCFREHSSYLKSDFSQRVRATFFGKSLEEYAREQTTRPFMHYTYTLHNFTTIFGADNVKAFPSS